MNKRVEIMRFADGVFKLMENSFPDFKGFRYDYNASAIVMAVAANIAEGLEQKHTKGGCVVKVPVKILEKFFGLYDLDIYDYNSFADLETSCSYTKSGVKLKQPLFLGVNPQAAYLEVLTEEDLYNTLKQASFDELPGVELLTECRALLRGL